VPPSAALQLAIGEAASPQQLAIGNWQISTAEVRTARRPSPGGSCFLGVPVQLPIANCARPQAALTD
jgi:hypothetical protein